MIFGISISKNGVDVRCGDYGVNVGIPKAVQDVVEDAIDNYSPVTFTDHSEVPEVTLPVKAGQ